jgi:hypothetical protein
MRIKNWTKFQHFKDRRPPWVKLYRDILDDLEWHELDPLAAKVLVMLWLIASEDDGRIPDTKTLAFRLRLTEIKTKEIIIKLSHWLEQDDINVISSGYQIDSTERETETEKETETKKEKNATKVACPPDVSEQVWNDWLQLRKTKKASVTETVLKGARSEANKIGWTLEQFLIEWCTRGSQGLKAEWLKEKLTRSEERQNVMAELTRGKSIPQTPFWAKPETVILEAQDVERKRLL